MALTQEPAAPGPSSPRGDDSPPPPIPSLPDGAVARVFAFLSPRELAVASAVSAGWHGLSAGSDAWRRFYAHRWPLPSAAPGEAGSWQRLYGRRALGGRCWAAARPQQDTLLGHTSGVRCVGLLEEQGLAFTGSTDGTLRAWSLPGGVSLGGSRQHGGSVRCLAVDARTLASGCSDGNIRIWQSSGGSGGESPLPQQQRQQHAFSQLTSFRLGGPRAVLPGGHTGPVTGLALLPGAVVSGSWDQTVRIWDRSAASGEVGACAASHRVGDWVASLEVCGDRCLVAAGASVTVASLAGGGWRALHALPSHSGAVTSAVGSLDGRYVWFATTGGSVLMSDERCSGRQQAAMMEVHSAPGRVSSLSWRDPWLAVAEQGGLVTLLDVEAWQRRGATAQRGSSGSKARGRAGRVLYSPGSGGAALGGCLAVCLGDQWAAAGFDQGAALTWDASSSVPDPSAQPQSPQKKRRQQRREQRDSDGVRAGGLRVPSSAAPVPIQSRPLPSFPSAPEAGAGVAQGRGMGFPGSGGSPAGSVARLGASPSGTRRLVPAPVNLAHQPSNGADGRRRRQAAWQVLTRGGRAAEAGTTPPAEEAAGARAPPAL